MARTSSHPLVDHEDIRRWVEARGGQPACVKGTGGRGDVGMLRIDMPGYSGRGKLQRIEWEDFFEKFDEQNLALMVQDKTAGGQKSNFNKLVDRVTAAGNGGGGARSASRGRSSARGVAASSRSGARPRSRSGGVSKGLAGGGPSRSSDPSMAEETASRKRKNKRTGMPTRGAERAATTKGARGGSHRTASRSGKGVSAKGGQTRRISATSSARSSGSTRSKARGAKRGSARARSGGR